MALQQPFSALLLATAATLFLAGMSTGFPSVNHSPARNLIFLEEACNSTLYPSLCFSSLFPYAHNFKTNQRKLAIYAIVVGIGAADNATDFLSELLETTSGESRDRAALSDCLSVLGDGTSQMRDSIRVLKHLKKYKRESQIADVQTWLSAALTNVGTCTDGFEDLTGKVKEVVDRKIDGVTKLTSNELALVNRLAYGIRQ